MKTELSPTDWKFVERLRKQGFAVTIFNPADLGDAYTDSVEQRMCEAGWDEINRQESEAREVTP